MTGITECLACKETVGAVLGKPVTKWLAFYTDGSHFKGRTEDEWEELPEGGLFFFVTYHPNDTLITHRHKEWYKPVEYAYPKEGTLGTFKQYQDAFDRVKRTARFCYTSRGRLRGCRT